MNSAFTIHEGRLTGAQLQRLRIENGFELMEAAILKKAFSASWLLLSAECDNETVGALRVVGDGCYIFVLADLIVSPQYSGIGIGSALVTHALAYIRQSLPEGHGVLVSLFSAKGRESFYRRLGFVDLPSEVIGAGMVTYVEGFSQQL